ncbi:signal peptidase I [Edaphobacter flagellatus]|uniref:signal peptidase I n=1 Tax=Edaphobacter flagellatus TaxID=1933044 RepID=UPI0021B1C758|nr:signal peptidase I [Edaphobacter flagellatus]
MSGPVTSPEIVTAPSQDTAPPASTQITPSTAPKTIPHFHQRHGFLPAVQSLTSIIVVAVFIVTFAVQPFRIPSGSMEPTLLIGDFLLVDKQVADSSPLLPATRIHRGDIVIFHYPVDPSIHLVKRVVGVPGDHVRLRGGHVLINGRNIDEPYAVYRPSAPDNFRDNFPRLESADPEIDSRWWVRMRRLVDNGELIVPTGDYFVLGDNRNDSEDSRYWGFVPEENIVGKPLLIYFSLRQNADDTRVAAALPRSGELATGLFGFARWDRILRVIR